MASPRRVVLADASALVAVLEERDRNHHGCAELLRTIRDSDPLTTCAAFTEAMYLLGSRHGWPGRRSLWELVESGVLRVAPERRDDWSAWRNSWPGTAICPWHSPMRNSWRSPRIFVGRPSLRWTATLRSIACRRLSANAAPCLATRWWGAGFEPA
jgi:hypothetical protein